MAQSSPLNEQTVARQLNWYYYGIMVLTLLVVTLMYFLYSKGYYLPLDTMSAAGKTIQYIVIFDALLTIPGGLYGFSRLCKRLSREQDEERRFRLYRRYAALRIVLVSNAMPLGVVAFYLFGCYRSMMWVAAIAAIGWYFTKPTARKIEIELSQSHYEETY